MLSKTSPLPDNQIALRDGMHDIAAADDADQFALALYRDALNFALREQCSNLINGRLFVDGGDFATHNVCHAQPITVDLADDVGFSDDTYNNATGINYGESTDTLLV